MTKISKETKLKALLEYFQGTQSLIGIARKYGVNKRVFGLLVAAYKTHSASVLFDPPKVTKDFRLKVARWAIINNASYTQVAAEFGYLGIAQIKQWKEIYRNQGPNGLMSITKGRKPKMNKKTNQIPKSKQELTPEQNRIKQLEDENLELRIKNEALKLLASKKRLTKKSPK